VHYLTADEPLPDNGIIVGEAAETDDMAKWAQNIDARTLPAGGADFFEAILSHLLPATASPTRAQPRPAPPGKSLFVCGSASGSTRSFAQAAQQRRIPLLSMPTELARPGATASEHIDHWSEMTCRALTTQPTAVVVIGMQPLASPRPAGDFVHYLSQTVRKVLAGCPVRHLYVEGGATASALVRLMDWTALPVISQPAAGVVTMKTPQADTDLTIKPGSYPWPDIVLPEQLRRRTPPDR